MDRLNHLSLAWLYVLAIGFAAACFGIGALAGALLNRRQR